MKVPQQQAFNPMQIMSQFFGGKIPQFDENVFRQLLPKIDNEKLTQLQNMAKSIGMSDEEIENGMRIIRNFKK